MRNTEDDSHLHLQWIAESDLLVRQKPNWINSCRVYAMLVSREFVSCFEIVAGLKEVYWNRNEVIVHESAKECKESHKQQDIAQKQEAVHWSSSKFWLKNHQEGGKEEESTSMAHVSKHHSEEEGEGHACVDGWVDLLVRGHAISVNNLLVHLCKLICFQVSRRLNFLKRNFFQVNLQLSRVVSRSGSLFRLLPIIGIKKPGFFKGRPKVPIGNGTVVSQFIQLFVNGFLSI